MHKLTLLVDWNWNQVLNPSSLSLGFMLSSVPLPCLSFETFFSHFLSWQALLIIPLLSKFLTTGATLYTCQKLQLSFYYFSDLYPNKLITHTSTNNHLYFNDLQIYILTSTYTFSYKIKFLSYYTAISFHINLSN